MADGLQLLGGVEQGIRAALAGEEADAVLEVDVVVELGEVRIKPAGVGAGDDQHGLALGYVDLVHRGQGLDLLVAPAGFGLEQLREALAQFLERLVVQVALGGGAQAGDQVLDVLDEEPPVAACMEVPGSGDQAVDDLVLELGDVPARGAEIGDDLGQRQAPRTPGDGGQGCDQEQLHHVLGLGAAQVGVQDLGHRLAV